MSRRLNSAVVTEKGVQVPATCPDYLSETGALTGPTITSLQQQIQNAAGGTALATRVTAAESRIDTLNASLANLGTNAQITALQTQVNAAVAVNTTQDTSITALQTRATAIETKNTQQDTSITALQTTSTQNTASINDILTKNTQQDTSITALQTRATALETKNTEQDAGLTAQGTRLTALEGTEVIRAQNFLKSLSFGTDAKRSTITNTVVNGTVAADLLAAAVVSLGQNSFRAGDQRLSLSVNSAPTPQYTFGSVGTLTCYSLLYTSDPAAKQRGV